MHAVVHGVFDVAENPCYQIEMRLPWRMHVEARLLNGMGDVRASERQVLQGTGIAAVLGRISEERAIVSGELAADVDGGPAWIAVYHVGTLEELESVLPLG